MDSLEDSDVADRLEKFKVAAKSSGVKLTHQRLEIFREIASSREHPDAETLLRALKPRMATVSLDTIYRTLWMLKGLGLVSTLGPRRDSLRFDANVDPHHHFVCVRCGRVSDFENRDLDSLPIPAQMPGVGTVLATRVEVTGVCEGCAGEQA
jgi:Fur family transcriptional regulator, peroxide stress response regulator